MNCSILPTVHRFLLTQSAVNPHIWHYCIVLQRTDWLLIVTEIKVALQCKNLTPISCPVEACNYDAIYMTSLPSSSPRFSLLAVIVRTTLNKITPRRFQQHLQKAPLCNGITFHLFIFTYFPAFAIPQAKRTKQIFESLQCKSAQHRVRKCVHEGKPRATNRSRFNQITVQCKVGKWLIQTLSKFRKA